MKFIHRNKKNSPLIKKGPVIYAHKEPVSKDKISPNIYCNNLKHALPYWDELIHFLEGQDTHHYMILDILEKLGFLFISKELSSEYEENLNLGIKKRYFVQYFTYTFIYSTKAFLDSISVFLNTCYQLGLQGGDIDIKKSKFLKKLQRINPNLEGEISLQNNWIQTVVKITQVLTSSIFII